MSVPLLRVISLGAGVQSTTMALMAAHGEIGPMPDAAIFADTQDEPPEVYEHLRWLSSPNVLPFPVHIVTEGKLIERLLAGDEGARVPFFIKDGGLKRRQCTRTFKLRPIKRKIRALLGVGPRGYLAPGAVEQWVGISRDEAARLKPSRERYIIRRDPLIEKLMTRNDCLSWLTSHGYPTPPKSACEYCPFQEDARHRARKLNDPAGFLRVVEIDRELRSPENIIRFHGETFVHRSRMPLEDVDFSAAIAGNQSQGDLFINECEGMCGT